MEAINLLAYIQIALAFDFGLIYLSTSHIFQNLLQSFLEEMSERNAHVIKRAQETYKTYEHHKQLAVRAARARLGENLNTLNYYLNPQNTYWEKYSYIGIYSGIYGLMCLLLIGMSGCPIESYIHNFLLISGELILVFQCVNSIRISRAKRKISIIKILNKLLWFITILVVSMLMSATGLFYQLFCII